jgi:hypothetical protein
MHCNFSYFSSSTAAHLEETKVAEKHSTLLENSANQAAISLALDWREGLL